MLVHLLCTERGKWGTDPGLTIEGTMYNLTHLSGVLSTPNLGVVDENCTFSLCYYDLFGQTNNDVQHTLYFG